MLQPLTESSVILHKLVPTQSLRYSRSLRVVGALVLCGSLTHCSGSQDDFGAIDGDELEESNSNASAITAGNLVDVDYFNANNHAQATVRFDPEGNSWCSGTKIGPHRFLTAAHCVDETWVGAVVHITNRLDGQFSGTGSHTWLTIQDLFIHPTWAADPSVSESRDVAIFDVAEETPDIPALDAEQFDFRFFPDSEWAREVAYGCDDVGTNDNQKQWGDFQAWSRSSSPNGRYYDHYYDRNITSYTPGIAGCPGDSGGPLFQDRGGWRLVGIVSNGDGTLTSFARIHDLATFINRPEGPPPPTCAQACNTTCTANIRSGDHTDGVGECIQNCIANCP
jgi:hypothetical protein